MNTPNGPIKRSPYLAPFSREHHDVLLFVWKIRQGIRNGIPGERIVPYCHWYYTNYMKDHFASEELGFKNIIPPTHPMLVQMTEDHRTIEATISSLSNHSEVTALESLATIVEAHVRFEERKLFGVLEAMATKDQLEKLLVNETKEHPSDWKDEFWTKQV